MEIIRTGLGSRFEHPKWNTHDQLFVVPHNIGRNHPSHQHNNKKQIDYFGKQSYLHWNTFVYPGISMYHSLYLQFQKKNETKEHNR